MISGVINVYKEKGYTSHDVVAKLRGILRQKKIGHTGTLDPQAEGVLAVCLGSGTKLCDMRTDAGKTYEAVLLLGKTTDTQDTSGNLQKESSVTCTADDAAKKLRSFIGEYDQIPPMYSARKVQGKKLYELARAGVEVKRTPQRVAIYDIQIREISLPEIVFSVSCSKGTYIRTLCHDVGEALGCGGCMKSLKRTRVGEFEIADSLKLSEIEKLREEGTLMERIYPVDSMFPQLARIHILPEHERLLKNGNPLGCRQIKETVTTKIGSRIRVYDTEDIFCGIYAWNEEKKIFVPEKMFLGI